MRGFDSRFKSFPDYILGITEEIWEKRRIASLRQYYADDILVRSPDGITRGNEAVIAATMATLSALPDRTLYGEDVIWCGTPDQGMLSSHRIFSRARYHGNGLFGAIASGASSAVLGYRILADCHAINNQINDEWLIRDLGAIARQLHKTPKAFALEQIKREGGHAQARRPYSLEQDEAGPYLGSGNDNAWGLRYREVLERIMQADMAVIPQAYDRAVQGEYPSGHTHHAHEGVDGFWMDLRASFPSATFEIHHSMGLEEALMPPRAALRWSLHGRHDGHGRFGTPSGAPVTVMGLSQAEFGPRGIRREYTLIDEPMIWKQILLHTGEGAEE